jgi:uncharacterized protein YdbL (DUF1318 family)
MRKALFVIVAVGLAAGLSCVRIPSKFEAHITVDIRQHIEQQAAGTLDFIEGKTDTLPAPATPTPPKKSSWLRHPPIDSVLQLLSPIATAYAAELKTSSAEITQLASSMRQRNEQIQEFKSKGLVGETNRGYLDLHADQVNGSSERNAAQRLIAAENKDRKSLYQEIAKLNKDQNVSMSEIERIYAGERLKRAKPAELFQLPPAGADFDAFKSSDAGKRLGTACVPGAWVTMK